VALFRVWRWHESGAMVVVASFPNDDNLINRYVAQVTLVVTQVDHTHFNLEHFTAQARRAAAEDIDLLTDKPG